MAFIYNWTSIKCSDRLEWFYSVLMRLELPRFVLVYAKAEINILIWNKARGAEICSISVFYSVFVYFRFSFMTFIYWKSSLSLYHELQ